MVAERQKHSKPLLTHSTNVKEDVSYTPRHKEKPHFFMPHMWLYEILSLILAAMILAAVIVVLAVYNHKPAPTVGSLTLNTLIALAATGFRLALMGPVTTCLGQATWIWLHRGYKPLNDVTTIDRASKRAAWKCQAAGKVEVQVRLVPHIFAHFIREADYPVCRYRLLL
jgi:hypothetical protein